MSERIKWGFHFPKIRRRRGGKIGRKWKNRETDKYFHFLPRFLMNFAQAIALSMCSSTQRLWFSSVKPRENITKAGESARKDFPLHTYARKRGKSCKRHKRFPQSVHWREEGMGKTSQKLVYFGVHLQIFEFETTYSSCQFLLAASRCI